MKADWLWWRSWLPCSSSATTSSIDWVSWSCLVLVQYFQLGYSVFWWFFPHFQKRHSILDCFPLLYSFSFILFFSFSLFWIIIWHDGIHRIFVQNTTIFKTDWWGHFPWAIVHLFKLPSNIFSLLVRSFLPFHVRWVHQSPKKFCGESENPLDVLQDSMRDCAYSCPCIWIGGVWSERVVSIALATVLLVLVLSTFGSLSKARFKFSPQILIHQLLYNLLLLWQNFQDRNEAPKEWCLYSKR